MVFSTLIFLFQYLPVVLFGYYLLPVRWRNLWLFAVSLFFYGWGEPVYILLMLFTIAVNYVGGMLIARFRDNDVIARRLLMATVGISLALLVFFKYTNLLLATFNSVFHTSLPLLKLSLPIGISFYTFQSMSYPIDVYRGDGRVQRSFVNFGAYVTLFPQLIAGPIVRYKDIDRQLDSRSETITQFASGVERFTSGLAKKVLLANGIGSLWDAYAASSELTVFGSWLGAVAFSLQIYFDFSGYSDMAIGLGRMFGFEFTENFNYPYISASVTEFWRRWHISLGTWFRDYVYIPLGGNRRGLSRQLLNIAVVWGLTGLWHGASWTFLLWGLYYALILVLEKLFLLRWFARAPAIGHLCSVLAAIFGWIIFQLDSVSAAAAYYGAMLGIRSSGLICATDLFYLGSYAAVLGVGLLAATPLLKKLYQQIPENIRRWANPVLIAVVLVLCTAKMTNDTYNPFLYFQF